MPPPTLPVKAPRRAPAATSIPAAVLDIATHREFKPVGNGAGTHDRFWMRKRDPKPIAMLEIDETTRVSMIDFGKKKKVRLLGVQGDSEALAQATQAATDLQTFFSLDELEGVETVVITLDLPDDTIYSADGTMLLIDLIAMCRESGAKRIGIVCDESVIDDLTDVLEEQRILLACDPATLLKKLEGA